MEREDATGLAAGEWQEIAFDDEEKVEEREWVPFNSREKRLLKTERLIHIRTEEGRCELESSDTGHRWIIRKQVVQGGRKVIIYHKHMAADKYYHKHAVRENVAAALREIRKHDLYVIKLKTAEEK